MTDPLKRAWALIPRDPKDPDVYRVARVVIRGISKMRGQDFSNPSAFDCVVEGSEGVRRIVGGNLFRTKAKAVKVARDVNKWAIIALRRREESRRREADRARIAHEKIKATLDAAIQFIKEHKL